MKILFAGRASELKRLRDILADRLLHLLHRLLSIEEIARHRIIDQRVPLISSAVIGKPICCLCCNISPFSTTN